MTTLTPRTVQAPASSPGVACGRYSNAAAIALIAAAPENSWVQLNANLYSDVWPPDDFRPLYLGAPQSESKIILAWSGFAWDNRRDELLLYGGGHANTNSNTFYRWQARTLTWQLGYYPSDVLTSVGGAQYPAGGYLTAPQSAHTYCNNIYLPRQDRFLTFGGATQPSGQPFAVYNLDTGLRDRFIGAYMLDTRQAGQGKVGGVTGSNPKRNTTAGVNLPGAQAWSVRDWYLDHPQSSNLVGVQDHVNGYAEVVDENGRDVVYFTAGNNGSTAHRAWRLEILDGDYRNDLITQVGAIGTDRSPQGCYHFARRLLVGLQSSANPIALWDINNAGPTNPQIVVPESGVSGTGKAALISALTTWTNPGGGCAGMAYDEKRQTILLYLMSGEVLGLTPPSNGSLSTGWTCTLLVAASATPAPPLNTVLGAQGVGSINGKWRRAQSLDVTLLLAHNVQGQVWAYKPAGWTNPRI